MSILNQVKREIRKGLQREVRPDLLPIYEQCGAFSEDRHQAGAPVKRRQSRIAECFRRICQGDLTQKQMLMADEASAAQWCANTAKLYGPCSTEADACRVTIDPSLPLVIDAIIIGEPIIIMIKVGRPLDCEAEAAALAYGHMGRRGLDHCAIKVLHADDREVETYQFSYEDAQGVYSDAVASFVAARETPCSHCHACLKAETCPARAKAAGEALELGALDMEHLKADPARGAEFLRAATSIDSFARILKRHYIDLNIDVPTYSKVKGMKFESVTPKALVPFIEDLGAEAILSIFSKPKGSKVRALFEAAEIDAPEEIFEVAHSMPRLRQNNKKK